MAALCMVMGGPVVLVTRTLYSEALSNGIVVMSYMYVDSTLVSSLVVKHVLRS
jgi:hypothetical protein